MADPLNPPPIPPTEMQRILCKEMLAEKSLQL